MLSLDLLKTLDVFRDKDLLSSTSISLKVKTCLPILHVILSCYVL